MSSSPATSVAIGSLLDFVGPSAPLPADDTDRATFDALLQPPPAPAPMPQQLSQDEPPNSFTPLHDEEQPAIPAANDKEAASHEPQASQPAAEASADGSVTASELPREDDPPEPEQRKHKSGETVIVESLAALMAVMPSTPIGVDGPLEEVVADATIDPGPIDAAAATEKLTLTPPLAPVAQHAGTTSEATSAQQQHQPQPIITAAAESLEMGIATASEVQHQSKGRSEIVVSLRAKNDEGRAEEKPAGKQSEPSLPDVVTAVEGASHVTESPQDQQHDSVDQAEHQPVGREPLAADASGIAPRVEAPVPTSSAETQKPLPPGVDQPTQTTAATTSSAAVLPATPAPRPRLPAEVLTQTVSGASRRPAIEIDTTRLMTRVARAFTAAQERDGEVRLRLSPPELGSLRLDVRVHDGVLKARVQTETDVARIAILDNLPALRERLIDQGVRIERFEVELMHRQPGGMPDQPGGRQHEPHPPAPRLVSTPRPRSEPTVSSNASQTAVVSHDGLNVII